MTDIIEFFKVYLPILNQPWYRPTLLGVFLLAVSASVALKRKQDCSWRTSPSQPRTQPLNTNEIRRMRNVRL